MTTLLYRFALDDTAVGAIEYGLVAATIAIGLLGALATLKTGLSANATAVPATARAGH